MTPFIPVLMPKLVMLFIKELFQPIPSESPRVQLVKTQKQVGSPDCGLFSITMATANLNG